MFRAIFVFLIFQSASVANANWTFLDGYQGTNHYINKLALIRSGHFVMISALIDETTKRPFKDSAGVFSIHNIAEFNCLEKTHRFLRWTYHAERMGKGTVLDSELVTGVRWNKIMDGSVMAMQFEIACKNS